MTESIKQLCWVRKPWYKRFADTVNKRVLYSVRETVRQNVSMPVAIDRTALRMPQYWSWWLESQMRFEI